MSNGNLAKVGEKVSVAVQPKSIESLIGEAFQELGRSLPQHMRAERISQIALTCVRTNPALARCTPASFIGALFTAAQLGLEPVAGNAYILPFNNSKNIGGQWVKVPEAQFIIGYKGLATLFYRHEKAVQLNWGVVHDKDEFQYEYGTDAYLRHRPAKDERGKVLGYYVIANLQSGGQSFMYMKEADCMAHGKKHSKTYSKEKDSFLPSSPWATNPEAMCLKTVLIQLSKLLPLSIELQQAISVDETSREYRKGIDNALDLKDTTNWNEPDKVKEPASSMSAPKNKVVVSAVTRAVEPTPADESDNAKMQDLKAVNNVIARIHILRDEKKLTDDHYYDKILEISGGKAISSKDLNAVQQNQLVEFLKAIPAPKTKAEEIGEKIESTDFPIFDDSDKFGESGIKLHIRLEYAEKDGEPYESLMVLKLFSIGEKWTTIANPVSVQDLIKQHKSAKAFFRGVILPRVSKDELYKNAVEEAIK